MKINRSYGEKTLIGRKKNLERGIALYAVLISIFIVISLITMPSASAFQAPVNQVYSSNWCGYVATGSKPFTDVRATWIVPSVSSNIVPAHSATWVGIGGFPVPTTMIQAGTGQFVTLTGLKYFAWYEVLPAPYVFVSDVFPGDTVTVAISKMSDRSPIWRITMTITSKEGSIKTFDNYVRFIDVNAYTAEFMLERPYGILVTPPLANFSTVTFTHCTANQMGLSKLMNLPVNMTSFGLPPPFGRTLASPGLLSDDSFTITYAASL
jgi:hypothetical protein